MLGQLAGDSLGGLVEFSGAESIIARYPNGIRDLMDGGHWNTLAGQPTDDSEMALALARTVISSGQYDPEAVARSYAFWYQSHPFDIGATTARALSAIPPLSQLPYGSRDGAAADAAMQAADRSSQGNGSLMRVSPLGIWGHAMDPDTLADGARADSRLTHPHLVCREACAVYVVAVAHAVATGDPPRDVYAFAHHWAAQSCRSPEVLETLEAAQQGPPSDYSRNQGWVLIAFQNAFFQLLHAPSLEDGIVSSVMAGGDTDTNAAIAGALLGAVYGREAVPLRWRQMILTCRPLAGFPEIRRPRPESFWPVDALDIAERLLITGGA